MTFLDVILLVNADSIDPDPRARQTVRGVVVLPAPVKSFEGGVQMRGYGDEAAVAMQCGSV